MSNDARVARYYPVARTAHMERIRDGESDIVLFYSETRSDFDLALEADLGDRVRKINIATFLIQLWRSKISVVEVPEPFAIRLWPQLVIICVAVRLATLFGRRKIRLVTYCIENYSPVVKLQEFTRLPKAISRVAVRLIAGFLMSSISRTVYGTHGAREVYEQILPPASLRRGLSKTVIALPQTMSETPNVQKLRQVCFLGTFEARKGILELLDCWDLIRAADGKANLVILGKGPLESEVREFVQAADAVSLLINPSREKIYDVLSESKVLVLLSKPSRGWREQVGLPIVEALSTGCEIVTTSETGIAQWLQENGHHVLDVSANRRDTADAIIDALEAVRSPGELVALLPGEDGRAEADKWLVN